MTLMYEKRKKCAVCRKRSKYSLLRSTNAFGYKDLDTRPPEMERSTINLWVQRCPYCGYCAPDISERTENSKKIVYSVSYIKQLNDPEFSRLANEFLCCSLIQENAEEYADAGWSNIHAAWACDDADLIIQSQNCRMKAVVLLQKAKENGQMYGQDTISEVVIMVDLLRRSCQFEKALKLCEEELKNNPEKSIKDFLRFQKKLINKSDIACYNFGDSIIKND